ncbi:MAG: carboxypeptidase-like regulatory domain-containing protein [Thaumarchaeota archaeon]|nr:carboxypeptidase-like regulatory domain-containing protein [Nitrososphaerota archaeon]
MLTIALGAVSLGFTSSLRGAFQSKENITPKAQPQGNLMVRAFYASGAPVTNATVLTRNLASSVIFPLPYHTDASGELTLLEPPGQYGVTVKNDQFQSSTILQVSEGNTTQLDVNVSQTIRASVFNELRTTGTSGFAPPWEQVVVAIPANSVFYRPGDTVFIQRFLSLNGGQFYVTTLPGPNGSFIVVQTVPINESVTFFRFGNVPNNPEIKADVVSSDLRVEKQTGLLWLTLQIGSFLPLDLSPGLQLVTYSASTQVSTRAG